MAAQGATVRLARRTRGPHEAVVTTRPTATNFWATLWMLMTHAGLRRRPSDSDGRLHAPLAATLPVTPRLLPPTRSTLLAGPILRLRLLRGPCPNQGSAGGTAVVLPRAAGPKETSTTCAQTAASPRLAGRILQTPAVWPMVKWAQGRSCSRQVKSRTEARYFRPRRFLRLPNVPANALSRYSTSPFTDSPPSTLRGLAPLDPSHWPPHKPPPTPWK